MKYQGIYVVHGVAGGGKTRFCSRQVQKICETVERAEEGAAPVAVCSLTKAAAREIASRDLPIPDWQVGTLHSMAYRQIGQPPVAESECKDFNAAYGDLAVSPNNDVDDSTGDVLIENTEAPGNELYQMYSLYRAKMVPRDQWSFDVVYFADKWEEWKEKNGLVDFSDMIDLAVTHGKGHAPGNPSVLIVDECLTGDTTVKFDDGRDVPIKDVVEQEMEGRVASFNRDTNSVVYKCITGWFKSPRRGRKIFRVGRAGMTEDHEVFVPGVNRFVRAEDAMCSALLFKVGMNPSVALASWRAEDPSGHDEVYCIEVEDTHCFFAGDILVKNCQDLSAQEWQLIRTWYEAAGAIIVSGDPHQSIYHWRGADASIFFDPAIQDDHRKYLSQSYRVPRLVRDLALRWMKENLSKHADFEYKPRPDDGALGMFRATTSWPDEIVRFVKRILDKTNDTIMIAASCGYMLKKAIHELRSEGIPFGNRWRRKRGDWNPLKPSGNGRATHHRLATFHELVRGRRQVTFSDINGILGLLRTEATLKHGSKAFFKELSGEAGKSLVLLSDVQNAFTPEAWAEIQSTLGEDDTGSAFCSWVREHGITKSAQTLEYVTEVARNYGFDALLDEPRLTLGTIHSYKGAEADHVILFPDLSQAGDRAFNGSPHIDEDDHDGVVRTFYVGMTRARKSLSVCDPNSRMFVDIPLTASSS